jgi:D-alanyl-D-alanine carboxypeptidase
MALYSPIDLASLGIDMAVLTARGLTPQDEAQTLVEADTDATGRQFYLQPLAAEAWHKLKNAASNDGITLVLESAFRSVARQTEIVQEKLAQGQCIDDILQFVAPPGYSEHHTGCAIDIGTPGSAALEEVFEFTAAYAWLGDRAKDFSFFLSYPRGNSTGYGFEPWHWCYKGN